MITFSAPYNFSESFIEEVIEPFSERVESVYLALPWPFSSTMRPWAQVGQNRRTVLDVDTFYQRVDALYRGLSDRGIGTEFVSNGEADAQQDAIIEETMIQLNERYPGSTYSLRSLTIANRLKQRRPEMDIVPSTMAFIRSAVGAIYWKKLVNPRIITVAREINRRPRVLSHLKEMGFRLRAVHEDGCIPECPVWLEHAQSIRLLDECNASQMVIDGPVMQACLSEALCFKKDLEFRWMQAMTVILPGHLKKMEGILDILKIEGRRQTNREIRRRLKRYAAGESLVSEHLGFEEPLEAWDMLANCHRNCESCGWCQANIVILGDRKQTAEGEYDMRPFASGPSDEE